MKEVNKDLAAVYRAKGRELLAAVADGTRILRMESSRGRCCAWYLGSKKASSYLDATEPKLS